MTSLLADGIWVVVVFVLLGELDTAGWLEILLWSLGVGAVAVSSCAFFAASMVRLS